MSHKILARQRAEYCPENLIFIQSRAEINFKVIDEYPEMMQEGTVFDPVEGVQDEDGVIFIFGNSEDR